jgi:hypothetical protein
MVSGEKSGVILMPFANFAILLTGYELGVVYSPTYRRLSSLPGKGGWV